MEKEKNFDDINLEEMVNSAIERMKNSDVYLLTNLDLYIYNSLKGVLEKLQNKERIEIIDNGFKEFFKPYIFEFYQKETDTASVMDASFDLIKTLERAKEFHLSYVNSFFRAVTNDEEFNLPLAVESCPFSSYY